MTKVEFLYKIDKTGTLSCFHKQDNEEYTISLTVENVHKRHSIMYFEKMVKESVI